MHTKHALEVGGKKEYGSRILKILIKIFLNSEISVPLPTT